LATENQIYDQSKSQKASFDSSTYSGLVYAQHCTLATITAFMAYRYPGRVLDQASIHGFTASMLILYKHAVVCAEGLVAGKACNLSLDYYTRMSAIRRRTSLC